MKYYIDTAIYFQGEKQPPRKIECLNLEEKEGMATFYDKDGDSYTVPSVEIFVESEADNDN